MTVISSISPNAPESGAAEEADLQVLDHDAAAALAEREGAAAVARMVRRLRASAPGTLVAAPASPNGPFDSWGADVVLARLPQAPQAAAAHALEQGVRSAGRPVLMDVRSPATPAEALVAALDAGAAGALVRTGDDDADRRFVAEALALEAARLDDAPLISVVVCNYNGARYLDRCLASLADLPYPRYEVVVCDDGSTDDSVAIARRYDVRIRELDHAGLSAARNAGVEAARGELVVFLDSDAEARPRWLERTWRLMDRLGLDGAGGPNLPFPDAGWEERVVSGAPGAPIPVVEPDGSAVHLAGCNMAFRRDLFERIGGFDVAFVSSEDVEFCLRTLDRGGRLALAPTAAVMHHRRDTIRGFLRQQRAYGAGSAIEQAPEPELESAAPRSLHSRMDLRRGRYVMNGPQARQLYTVTSQPLHIGLPVKVLAAGVAAGLAGAPLAARTGHLAPWSAASAVALAATIATAAVRAPTFAPEPGPRGAAQRLATAGLWFAMPVARRYGRWRASRS